MRCLIVYTGVILCCSCSLGAVSHVLLLMNECVIVYTGVILCCSCILGAVIHVFLLMNECVIVYTGHSFMSKNICTTSPNDHKQHRMTPE
jgi:hypothetical protein